MTTKPISRYLQRWNLAERIKAIADKAMARLGESQQEAPAGVPAAQSIPFPSVWPDIRRAASLSHFIK